MISTPDRRTACELIEEACAAGARPARACAELGLHVRTWRRWTAENGVKVDGRPTAERPAPANKLSEEERERVLAICHQPQYASLPPSQIVPALADEGLYVASEASFYRVLRAANEQHHRGRARAPQIAKPLAAHCATAPCQVWSWDITWLAGPARGVFFYLYLMLDVFSRKIVGWEVYERECGDHAAEVVRRSVLAEGIGRTPRVLHADNGSPMKGATLRTTLQDLGIEPSYSRPRVSNDNAFSEALFRTCKYRPDYPCKGFETVDAARTWVHAFVSWYNGEHRHSALRFVTPNERHSGHDGALLAQRKALYELAKARSPSRWSRGTRNWTPAEEVWLNPKAEAESTNEREEIDAL